MFQSLFGGEAELPVGVPLQFCQIIQTRGIRFLADFSTEVTVRLPESIFLAIISICSLKKVRKLPLLYPARPISPCRTAG